MTNRIHIQGLKKTYTYKQETHHALNTIDLDIPAHRIVGLIGPNGAGKTTLLKTIAGQLFPSEGSVSSTTPYQVCLVQEYEPSFTMFRVKALLEIAALHYPNWDQTYANDLLARFDLDTKKKYTQLSKGQRGLVGIIIALASKAPITLFDETHISLDVIMRQRFFDLLIEEYTDSNRTFILSTHYINEVSNLFENIIFMDKGKLLLHEEKDVLDDMTWTIVGDHSIGESLLDAERILKVNRLGKTAEFNYFGPLTENTKTALMNYDFNVTRSNLETFFLNLIHKEATNE